MKKVIAFLSKNSFFVTFLLLSTTCLVSLFSFNIYQKTFFINSSDRLIGELYSSFSFIKRNIYLKEKNEQLLKQNNYLFLKMPVKFDDNKRKERISKDDFGRKRFIYVNSRVLSNSTKQKNNFITLDIGKKKGVRKGMGVITSMGVVGIVIATTSNFSLIQSLLSNRISVGAKVQENKGFGFLNYGNQNVLSDVKLEHLPYTSKIDIGDTIYTSGYSFVYPPDIPLGRVKKVRQIKNQNFLDVTIKLFLDFQSLSEVYVVKHIYKKELDSLASIKERN